MYGQLYRRLLLPVFDRVIKRRHTLGYWADIERSQWWSHEQLEAHQLEAVRNLLAQTARNCPYYREEWQQRGLNSSHLQSLADLTAWPLIDRSTIREHRQRMRSTVATQLLTKATGGSSGEPLEFDFNSDSNDRRTAQMFRGYSWAGGAPGTKQLFIWGGALTTVPRWKRWKMALHHRLDRHLVLNCFEFTPERMRQGFDRLNRYRPEVIVAYTNPLYEFARFLDEHGLRPVAPRSIIIGAEKLHGFQRDLIQNVFRAPVFETYGSREFMLIGAECERHAGLHLSMENLLVEILDDDGTPTPAGQEGNVVITDLFNYGMPFVRYVNGDRAIAGFDVCSCGRGLPLLKQVTGRRLDSLTTPDGRTIPGEFFPHLLKDFPAIRRIQVVQRDPAVITLKLVAPSLTNDDRLLMLDAIHACTGFAVTIELDLVDDIPLTKVGKLKVVVREVDGPSLMANRKSSPIC
ncbi:MAG: phenylacetate--CoA ligase family protein [Planctomycetales bacterium]|nr:phenylacetate--CoA ligase family protein [Planctomycetales bacterium]